MQMTAHDAFAAHARDELGISEVLNAQPVQAALTSAATFAIGAALPLVVAWLAPYSQASIYIAITSLVFLALLGGLAAKTGGASLWKGAWRVTFWGALAMIATAVVGHLFGVAVG
jgi:VIT1/CCC1 family predicted Fe2+/Mn2+ transporter